MDYNILYFVGLILVIAAQAIMQGSYNKHRSIASAKNYTGEQVAKTILRANNLEHVSVEVSSGGTLSDHYDPKTNVVRLSKDVYYGNSIASISVAAHEVGHAIQYAESYGLIKIRTAILPVALISNQLSWIVLMIGLLSGLTGVFYLGIAMLVILALFQLVTLPIELNASSRAIVQLESNNLIEIEEESDCKSMLRAAAFTYLASLITALLQIVRLLLMRRRNK